MADEASDTKDNKSKNQNQESQSPKDNQTSGTSAGKTSSGDQSPNVVQDQGQQPNLQIQWQPLNTVFPVPAQTQQVQPINVVAQAQQQNFPNVQALVGMIQESTSEGNKSEATIPGQIILVSSAILAVIGVLAFNKDLTRVSIVVGTLLLLAIIGLGVSLLAGVFHFVSERSFWYKTREIGITALDHIKAINNPADKESVASQAMLNERDHGSNRIAFWTQIISFVIGIVALLILVCAKLIIKMK